MTDRTIPPAPRLLGLAGLIPFWGLALGLLVAPVAGWTTAQLAAALAAYGAVIVSFLGGIRWGLATAARGASAGRYAIAVLPSLAAWIALALPVVPRLAVLGIVALALGPLDTPLVAAGLAPVWFGRLRVILSAGAGAALLTAALTASLRG